MSKFRFISPKDYGYNFVPLEFLKEGNDEYTVRNEQSTLLLGVEGKQKAWRSLQAQEITILIEQGNICQNWEDVLVCDPFNPVLISQSFFAGLVRIGNLEEVFLQHHDLTLPVGIRNSRIISCDIGDNCVVQDCSYVSHFIIGNNVILNCVDELSSSNHAKFGEGILKEGESEDIRIWIDPINEAGGRSILPFKDLVCADAYLWTIYRDDPLLQKRLKEITQTNVDTRRGSYSTVGEGTVIKSSRIVKDVRIGEHCYIKGANKLKNLTIKSRPGETSQIGEGVELVNGIIGYGCQVFYGVKAVRFILGNNSNLKYGARLIHSILGDNSTVSCCEVLNNLVFPGHEQHHNNSFLIASLIMGQSNMAAGATLGSNHNSRGNNGELFAGRGFWPGLSCTVKHNSRFASYTLLAKGNFSYELNNPFPFAMLSDNVKYDELVIIPAYFWLYNMYALERNSWKYKVRDRRKTIVQHIETDYLAPDTAFEILHAIQLLESKEDFTAKIENSERTVRIVKAEESIQAYKQMLLYYGVRSIVHYLTLYKIHYGYFLEQVPKNIPLAWVNLGGQLVLEEKLESLIAAIRAGLLNSWDDIHEYYEQWWNVYLKHKAENGYEILCRLTGLSRISAIDFKQLVEKSRKIRTHIDTEIIATKQKDYDNPYRSITYRNKEDRDAVIGKIEDDQFIKEAKKDTAHFFAMLDSIVY